MLCTLIGAIILSINIQVGLNMHLYDYIWDASSSLWGSTSSFSILCCCSWYFVCVHMLMILQYIFILIFSWSPPGAALSIALFVLVLAFFEDKPPTPPIPLVAPNDPHWGASVSSRRPPETLIPPMAQQMGQVFRYSNRIKYWTFKVMVPILVALYI